MRGFSEPIKASVIICTSSLNRFCNALEAVTSIIDQSYGDKEIIVSVDNNYILYNLLKGQLEHKGVMVINNDEQQGLSSTRNFGIRRSSGQIIVFMDDDAIASKLWLENLVEHFNADDDVIGLGGNIVPLWDGGRPAWFPEELDWIVCCTYKGHTETFSFGCNMAFRNEVFLKGLMFDSAIGQNIHNPMLRSDERDLYLRINQAYGNKKKLEFDPSAIVYHLVTKERKTLTYLLRRSFYDGIAKRYLSNRWGNSLGDERSFVIYLVRHGFIRALRSKKDLSGLLRISALVISVMSILLGYLMGNHIDHPVAQPTRSL